MNEHESFQNPCENPAKDSHEPLTEKHDGKEPETAGGQKRHLPLILILLVLAAPLWILYVIVFLALLLSLYLTVWSVILSFWAVFASFIGVALGGVVFAAVLFSKGSLLTGLSVIGVSLISSGLAVLSFLGCKALTVQTAILTKKALFALIRSIKRLGEAI